MSRARWWARHRELVGNLLVVAASFASIAGLLFYFLPPIDALPWWAVLLIGTATAGFVLLVLSEFAEQNLRHVYGKSDTTGIRGFMHNWIEHGGRVAIWTRDMSWAQNSDTRQLLIEKAQCNELIICLPEMNAFTTELSEAGAEVCAYGNNLLEAPASRFTIVFFGRDGSRLAVGRAERKTHVIDEFDAGDHPAFHLAVDLVTLARALHGQPK